MEAGTRASLRLYLGEFLATFIFIFAVYACTLNSPISNLPTAGPLCAGFAAFVSVFAFNGHFNPAVTLGAMVGRKMSVHTGLIYMVIQLAASFVANGAIELMFPEANNSQNLMLQPAPKCTIIAAIFMETILTFILVLVIFRTALGVSVRPRMPSPDLVDEAPETVKEFYSRVKAAETRKNHAPLAIGLTIGFLATAGGIVSGGAFNPLRVTAPAFFTLNFRHVWIYWVGDCLGGLLAGLFYPAVFED